MLRLITAPTDMPVTLAEARAHLRVDDNNEDAYISSLIEVATLACEGELRRALMPQVWERLLDDFPSGAIRLGMPPVTAIQSITYTDSNGVVQTVSSSDYTLDAAMLPGWAVPNDGFSWPTDVADRANAVVIRFQCGYADVSLVPKPIKQWILLLIGEMFANRESSVDSRYVRSEFVDHLLDRYVVPQL